MFASIKPLSAYVFKLKHSQPSLVNKTCYYKHVAKMEPYTEQYNNEFKQNIPQSGLKTLPMLAVRVDVVIVLITMIIAIVHKGTLALVKIDTQKYRWVAQIIRFGVSQREDLYKVIPTVRKLMTNVLVRPFCAGTANQTILTALLLKEIASYVLHFQYYIVS